MNEKPIKYALHVRGKSRAFHDTALKLDLFSPTPFPSFRVGDYIGAHAFDFQYERTDRLVVLDVLWDFLAEEIHQHVIVHEEPNHEAIERSARTSKHTS